MIPASLDAPGDAATDILRKGSTGPAVRELSRTLVALGFLERESATFDLALDRAVRAFQATQVDERDVPLKVDGVVGPLTAWRLAHLDVGAPGRERKGARVIIRFKR